MFQSAVRGTRFLELVSSITVRTRAYSRFTQDCSSHTAYSVASMHLVAKASACSMAASLTLSSAFPREESLGHLRSFTRRRVVPGKGVEPIHPCGYYTLNVARLPVPPPRHGVE